MRSGVDAKGCAPPVARELLSESCECTTVARSLKFLDDGDATSCSRPVWKNVQSSHPNSRTAPFQKKLCSLGGPVKERVVVIGSVVRGSLFEENHTLNIMKCPPVFAGRFDNDKFVGLIYDSVLAFLGP